MRMLVSHPHPSGLVAFIAMPDDATITVTFADDDQTRDQTDWAADLLLIGFVEWAERADVNNLIGPETVEVGEVTLVDADVDDVGVGVLSPPAGTGSLLDWPTAVEMIAAGIASQVTEGVAADLADDSGTAPWNTTAGD